MTTRVTRIIREGRDSDAGHPSVPAGDAPWRVSGRSGAPAAPSPTPYLLCPLSEFTNLLRAPPFGGGPRVPLAGPHGNLWRGAGRGGRGRKDSCRFPGEGRTRDGSEVQAARVGHPCPRPLGRPPLGREKFGKGQTPRACHQPARHGDTGALSPAPSTAREQKPHYLIPKVKVERPRLPGIRGGGGQRAAQGASSFLLLLLPRS